MTAQSEFHLFVLWSKGRRHAEMLQREIARDFRLLAVTDLIWSRKHAFSNLLRFYNNRPLIILWKALRCGTGTPRLFLVEDVAPHYEMRDTTSGRKRVNVRMFEAKNRYRRLTGGGNLVHGTNSPEEFRHDYALLTGETPTDAQLASRPDWSGETAETRVRDLAGTASWESLAEFFRVMKACTPFLVLRNFDALPEKYRLNEHGDIDILTTSRPDFVRAANARKVGCLPFRVAYRVNIGGENVPLDLRSVGDGYYDSAWEQAMLADCRESDGGVPIPRETDLFYSLIYHALVHKYRMADDYRRKLLAMAELRGERPVNGEAPEEFLRKLLDAYLAENHYSYTEADDPTVYFNPRCTGRASSNRVRRLNAAWRKLRGKAV